MTTEVPPVSPPVDRSPNAPNPPAPKRPIWVYLIGLVVVAAIGIAIVGALQPGDPDPPCNPDVRLCNDPPPGGDDGGDTPTFPPIATVAPATLPPGGSGGTGGIPQPAGDPYLPGTTWTSTDLGFSVSYDPERWKVYRDSATDLVLVPQRDDFDFWVLFEGARSSSATPTQLIEARLDLIRQDYPGLELDEEPYTAIVGPHIGYIDAEGASYLGTGTGSDGQPLAPTGFAVLAASNGELVVGFTMGVGNPNQLVTENTRELVFRSWGDTLLKDFRWPS
jgi:hypothetical protein